MIIYSYKELEHGFKNILAKNRDYWLFDNDYRRKYLILEDAVENFEMVSFESKAYIFDILHFMLKASSRIFKTGIPVISAAGIPINDAHGIVWFSR